tara:strand:- start:788 stop:1261 length:474 start_codon:yes stop_codon:yes gene_type:complete
MNTRLIEMNKKCAVCGKEWPKGQKECPECDCTEWKEDFEKLSNEIAEIVQEEIENLRCWIVEVTFEVEGLNDADAVIKQIQKLVPGWDDQYEGHNLELVPMISGPGKVGVVTMFWRFTMQDGVLAVALTQKLVEEREKAEMDEFVVECNYKEDEWED